MSNKTNHDRVKVQIKTITPMFIGTGQIISRAEMALENNILHVASIDQMSKLVEIEKLNKLVKKAITEKKTEHRELEEIIKKGYSYRVAAGKNVNDISLELREIIKVRNKLYLPGSSIKGAILSALINTALTDLAELSDTFEEFVENIVHKSKFRNPRDINEALIGLTFAWLKERDGLASKFKKIDRNELKQLGKNRFNRWIQVTDTNLKAIGKYGVILPLERKGGRGAPPPILAELIRRNKEFEFEINLLDHEQEVKIDEILKLTDEYYRKLYQDEIEWCEERNINILTKPLEKKENEFLVRIGFGSGNKAISIMPTIQELDPENVMLATFGKNWRLTKAGGAVAKSKWFATYKTKDQKVIYSPLGWAKISII